MGPSTLLHLCSGINALAPRLLPYLVPPLSIISFSSVIRTIGPCLCWVIWTSLARLYLSNCCQSKNRNNWVQKCIVNKSLSLIACPRPRGCASLCHYDVTLTRDIDWLFSSTRAKSTSPLSSSMGTSVVWRVSSLAGHAQALANGQRKLAAHSSYYPDS